MDRKKLIPKHDEYEKILLNEIEKEARKILKRRTNLHEFIMAMGSCFFTTKNNSNINYTVWHYTAETEYCEQKYFRDFSKLHEIFREYNHGFKLTGSAMRFTADGEIITDW